MHLRQTLSFAHKLNNQITKVHQKVSLSFLKSFRVFSNKLTESGLDNIDNSGACVDVGDDLAFAEGILSAFFKDHDLWCLNTQVKYLPRGQVLSSRNPSELNIRSGKGSKETYKQMTHLFI